MARILMVVTSADRMPDGEPTGLWLEEAAVPYVVLREAGHEVVVASPRGGATPIDPRSKQEAPRPEWAEAEARLRDTRLLAEQDPAGFDAIFIPGGHGTMFDLPDNHVLGLALAHFHGAGKPIASVCHGPAAFVGALRGDGRPLVEGYTLTAFSDEEERMVGLDGVVPFLLASRLRELGARVENGPPMASHVREDGGLVTGQNPASSRAAAERLAALLG
jgi:putative intracellular protease/amidase